MHPNYVRDRPGRFYLRNTSPLTPPQLRGLKHALKQLAAGSDYADSPPDALFSIWPSEFLRRHNHHKITSHGYDFHFSAPGTVTIKVGGRHRKITRSADGVYVLDLPQPLTTPQYYALIGALDNLTQGSDYAGLPLRDLFLTWPSEFLRDGRAFTTTVNGYTFTFRTPRILLSTDRGPREIILV